MSIRSSTGHANTIDSSHSYHREYPQFPVNDRSSHHFSTVNESYAYDCGLPNDFDNNCHVNTSSEVLPPTALMFVQSNYSSNDHLNQLSNGQSNYSSNGQSLSRQSHHAPNSGHANYAQSNYSSSFNYRQSRPPLPPPASQQYSQQQQQQQYYGQSYPNEQHSTTLPARGGAKMIYPQQLSNGYGNSSVGKASAITMGVGQANHIRPPPQFASAHMASYHTKMFPSTETQLSNSMGQSHEKRNEQRNENKYVKKGTENPHKMSTEL